jgi:protein gp37
MKNSPIGWCHHTINFWMGCEPVSAECKGCYARALMRRQGEDFGVLRLTQGPWLQAEVLNASAKARNVHELVFTCSMSDFFHEQADPWREEAWDVIRRSQNLIWLVLTKRPERIPDCLPKDWDEGRGFPNVWLGTICGTPETFDRVDLLRKVPCALRFISCEPLMADISNIDFHGIEWVLCGGMSGAYSKTDPMDLRWAAALYDTAHSASVPFLFKQISHQKPEQGINALGLYLAHRDGWPAAPEAVDCVREYPEVAGHPIIHPGIQGMRLNQAEWESYRRRHVDHRRDATEARRIEQVEGGC